MRVLIAAAAAAALTAFAAPAIAEQPTDMEIVFIKADENGDGVLSKGEVLIISIRQFQEADANGDGVIDAEEAGDLATNPEFSDNDADKSGSLSLEEMITEKLADFKSIDADGDGFLTMEEIEAAYPGQK
jgi:Ca2+-binding EF-hand superfamily protein